MVMVAFALLVPFVRAGKADCVWGLPLAQLQGEGARNEEQPTENGVEADEEKLVRVDISVLAPPLKDYDEAKEEVCGFVKNLLDIISYESGLTFRFLEPKGSAAARSRLAKGEADIWICYGGNSEPMEGAELGKECVMLPMVRVCHKDEVTPC